MNTTGVKQDEPVTIKLPVAQPGMDFTIEGTATVDGLYVPANHVMFATVVRRGSARYWGMRAEGWLESSGGWLTKIVSSGPTTATPPSASARPAG